MPNWTSGELQNFVNRADFCSAVGHRKLYRLQQSFPEDAGAVVGVVPGVVGAAGVIVPGVVGAPVVGTPGTPGGWAASQGPRTSAVATLIPHPQFAFIGPPSSPF